MFERNPKEILWLSFSRRMIMKHPFFGVNSNLVKHFISKSLKSGHRGKHLGRPISWCSQRRDATGTPWPCGIDGLRNGVKFGRKPDETTGKLHKLCNASKIMCKKTPHVFSVILARKIGYPSIHPWVQIFCVIAIEAGCLVNQQSVKLLEIPLSRCPESDQWADRWW